MKSPWCAEHLQPQITNPPRSKLVKRRKLTDHPRPNNLVAAFPERNTTHLKFKTETKKQDQPNFFYLEDLRTSRYKESKYPPMNHSIIPGAHGFRQEAHPQSHGQRYAEYHLGHQPTHGHRDGHLRNEIPPPSIRPHPAAPWETFHNAAERRDIWTNKTHEKSNKNLNVEVLRPTNIQEIRTVPAHASIKHVSPVHTERPVQVFGLEYTGKDKFHCHHIKSPELEQKKVNRVANLSDDEADGLWSEIEDLLHHMSPKPHNHPPGGHEMVNNTALQGPFMRRDDMPSRIQENLTKASRLPPQAPLAGPSIAAYHSESLHPDIICTIRALREEP